jgi:hypothetical protein
MDSSDLLRLPELADATPESRLTVFFQKSGDGELVLTDPERNSVTTLWVSASRPNKGGDDAPGIH